MPVTVDAANRELILRYATCVPVRPDDGEAIVVTADMLLEWVALAEGPADLRARMAALGLRYETASGCEPPQTAEGFLAGARVLYAFIASAPPPARPADAEEDTSGADDEELRTKLDRILARRDDDRGWLAMLKTTANMPELRSEVRAGRFEFRQRLIEFSHLRIPGAGLPQEDVPDADGGHGLGNACQRRGAFSRADLIPVAVEVIHRHADSAGYFLTSHTLPLPSPAVIVTRDGGTMKTSTFRESLWTVRSSTRTPSSAAGKSRAPSSSPHGTARSSSPAATAATRLSCADSLPTTWTYAPGRSAVTSPPRASSPSPDAHEKGGPWCSNTGTAVQACPSHASERLTIERHCTTSSRQDPAPGSSRRVPDVPPCHPGPLGGTHPAGLHPLPHPVRFPGPGCRGSESAGRPPVIELSQSTSGQWSLFRDGDRIAVTRSHDLDDQAAREWAEAVLGRRDIPWAQAPSVVGRWTADPDRGDVVNPMALYDVLDGASLAIQYAEDGRTGAAQKAHLEASLSVGDAAPLDSDLSRALGVILEYVGALAAGSAVAA